MISPVEGVLRVRKDVELDRETIAFYNLTICARDRGVPPLSSTVSPCPSSPTAHSRDPPEALTCLCERGHESQSMPLRASPGSSLGACPMLSVLHPCHSPPHPPSHLLAFYLTCLPLSLPPSSPPFCSSACLLSPPSGWPQMLVGIRVLDINDNDPVLLNLPLNITISENSPVSSFVAHVLASDADSGCNALLTFNITAGNRERAFRINATVGRATGPPGPRAGPGPGPSLEASDGCSPACFLFLCQGWEASVRQGILAFPVSPVQRGNSIGHLY